MARWSKSDWKRFWLHLPVGFVGAWFTWEMPVAGVMFTVYFLAYEVLNDWKKDDKSYKDVIGAVAGYGILTGIAIVFGWFR